MKFKQRLFIAGAVLVPILGGGSLAYASTSGASTGPGAAPVTTQASSTGAETPDTGEAAGPSPETAPTSGTDASGGHQDPAGSNADHQFQGQE